MFLCALVTRNHIFGLEQEQAVGVFQYQASKTVKNLKMKAEMYLVSFSRDISIQFHSKSADSKFHCSVNHMPICILPCFFFTQDSLSCLKSVISRRVQHAWHFCCGSARLMFLPATGLITVNGCIVSLLFVFDTKQHGSDMTVFEMKQTPASAFMKEAAVCSCHQIYTQPKELTVVRLQARCLRWYCVKCQLKCCTCICSLSGRGPQQKVTVALSSLLFCSRSPILHLLLQICTAAPGYLEGISVCCVPLCMSYPSWGKKAIVNLAPLLVSSSSLSPKDTFLLHLLLKQSQTRMLTRTGFHLSLLL